MRAGGEGGVGDDFGAEDIVLHGFTGIFFHERDVLVGGTMEDDVGALVIENFRDAGFIADVSETGTDVSADPALAQLAIDLEEGIFGALEENEPTRAEFH